MNNSTDFILPDLFILLTRTAIFVAVLLVCYLLIPIQWDKKSLRVVSIQSDPPVQSGSDILYVSRSTIFSNRTIASYGLDLLSFPSGKDQWLVLDDEGVQQFPWPTYIDGKGRFFYRGNEDGRSEQKAKGIAETGVVVVEDETVAKELLERWPDLSASKVVTKVPSPAGFFGYGSQSLSVIQVVRVLWICLLYAGIAFVLSFLFRDVVLACGFAFPLLLFGLISLIYLSGFFSSNPEFWGVAILTLVLAFFLIKIANRVDTRIENYSVWPLSTQNKLLSARAFAVVISTGLFAYLLFVALNMDFDGDLFTHWLPSARSHYYNGHHDIEFLLTRYGGAHETTYPPGFPIFLSLLMWVANVNPVRSMQLGAESSLMIYLYRIYFGLFFFSLIVTMFRVFSVQDCKRDWQCWVSAPLLLLMFIPFLSGKPYSAEILFVPCVGFAILAFVTAAHSGESKWLYVGTVLTIFLLLIKNESILVVPLVVFPWIILVAAEPGCSESFRSNILKFIISIGIAAIPYLTWKISILPYEIDQNFMFDPVSLPLSPEQMNTLKNVYLHFITTSIKSGTWILFFCLIPVASILSCIGQKAKIMKFVLARLAIPAALLIYFFGVPIIYVFTRSEPIHHFDTSFNRLSLSAAIGAVIYISFVVSEIGRKKETQIPG